MKKISRLHRMPTLEKFIGEKTDDLAGEAQKLGIEISDGEFDGEPIKIWTMIKAKSENFSKSERAMDWLIKEWKSDENTYNFFRLYLSPKDDVITGNYQTPAIDVMDYMKLIRNWEDGLIEHKRRVTKNKRINEAMDFPMTMDYAEDNEDWMSIPEFEKCSNAIKNMTKIDSVKIVDEFTDDHLPGFDLILQTDSGEVKITMAWLSTEGLRTIYTAEDGSAKGLKGLYDWIKSDLEDYS